MPAAYDAIAEWYDEFLRTQPYLFDVVIPATLDLIARAGELRDQHICDLACGQGILARELARRPRGGDRHLRVTPRSRAGGGDARAAGHHLSGG